MVAVLAVALGVWGLFDVLVGGCHLTVGLLLWIAGLFGRSDGREGRPVRCPKGRVEYTPAQLGRWKRTARRCMMG